MYYSSYTVFTPQKTEMRSITSFHNNIFGANSLRVFVMAFILHNWSGEYFQAIKYVFRSKCKRKYFNLTIFLENKSSGKLKYPIIREISAYISSINVLKLRKSILNIYELSPPLAEVYTGNLVFLIWEIIVQQLTLCTMT